MKALLRIGMFLLMVFLGGAAGTLVAAALISAGNSNETHPAESEADLTQLLRDEGRAIERHQANVSTINVGVISGIVLGVLAFCVWLNWKGTKGASLMREATPAMQSKPRTHNDDTRHAPS